MKFNLSRFYSLLEKNLFFSQEEKESIRIQMEKTPPSKKNIYIQILEDAYQDQKSVLTESLRQKPELFYLFKQKHRKQFQKVWQTKENQKKQSDALLLKDLENQFLI